MQAIDQAIDGGRRIVFCHVGQACIACRSSGAGVAKQALNMPQAQALFEQMRGEAVAQGVDRHFFLIPHCATTAFIAAWVLPRSM